MSIVSRRLVLYRRVGSDSLGAFSVGRVAFMVTAFPDRDEAVRIIGANVRAWRERTGISAVKLAQLIDEKGTDRLYKAERGEREFHHFQLIRLATAFGCSVDDFYTQAQGVERIDQLLQQVKPG